MTREKLRELAEFTCVQHYEESADNPEAIFEFTLEGLWLFVQQVQQLQQTEE
jgi:hypothetical protein